MGIASSVSLEESNEGNSSPITRTLPKKFDPRSPSESIVRTPIEVICTPKSKEQIKLEASLFDTPTCSRNIISPIGKIISPSYSNTTEVLFSNDALPNSDQTVDFNCAELSAVSDTDNIKKHVLKETVVDQDVELAKEVTENVPIENQSKSSRKQLAYLETDIDAVEDNFTKKLHIEHPRVRQLRHNKEPTGPVSNEHSLVDDTVITDTLSSRIDSLSFTDVSFDDPSLFVSDNETDNSTSDHHYPAAAIKDWLITVEDDCHSILPFTILGDDKNQSMQKSNFLTPDRKTKSSKERTPLGCLVQNKVHETIKNTSDSKKKQWRSIQDERLKLGISGPDENTPPPQKQLDHISSAPGKLMRHRRAIDWDRDVLIK